VNRLLILVALLAVFLAACGTQTADDATATLTPEPTVAATEAPEDTVEPAATDDDDGGVTGSLDDVIPDELNGVAGTPIPGLDQILGQALQGQGLDAEDAEFAFVTYGEGADAVVLNAFRIPGVTEAQLALLGQLMSGSGGAGEVEATTEEIGGKTVLSFSGGGQEGVVYVYIVDDVAFTVAGQDTSAVEQLLSELP
jgi:hypothetical protein